MHVEFANQSMRQKCLPSTVSLSASTLAWTAKSYTLHVAVRIGGDPKVQFWVKIHVYAAWQSGTRR